MRLQLYCNRTKRWRTTVYYKNVSFANENTSRRHKASVSSLLFILFLSIAGGNKVLYRRRCVGISALRLYGMWFT